MMNAAEVDETPLTDQAFFQRMVQVDGGEAVSLETFLKVNSFAEGETDLILDDLRTAGEALYGIGGGGWCHIKWASDEAAKATDEADAAESIEPTVFSEWGLRCHKCGCDHMLNITGEVTMRLTPEGTIADGDHTWGPASRCICEACLHEATVADFTVEKDGG